MRCRVWNPKPLLVFGLGLLAFAVSTAGGILTVKTMNLFLRPENQMNTLIGSAGVSAVPMAARVAQNLGQEYDPGNFLLMHAMGPNLAGVMGTAAAAGIRSSKRRKNSPPGKTSRDFKTPCARGP